MTILTETILFEFPSARQSQLAQISPDRAQEILSKVKSLYFALWQGEALVTTQQVSEFYEVPEENVRQLLKTYRDELESDGLKTLRGKALNDVRDLLSLTSKTVNVTVWTPRSVLRIGMTLRNSAIATTVRTTLLNAVEKVIPTQAQEMERLRLELDLIRAKQRYQDTAQAILTTTSPSMLAYLRGDGPVPTQIIYRDHFIDPNTRLELGSAEGRSLSQLITDAGLNPKSTKDRNKVKRILRCCGFDYDLNQGWSTACYLREFKVLPDEIYGEALKAVLREMTAGDSEPNLFVYQWQQASLSPAASMSELGKPT